MSSLSRVIKPREQSAPPVRPSWDVLARYEVRPADRGGPASAVPAVAVPARAAASAYAAQAQALAPAPDPATDAGLAAEREQVLAAARQEGYALGHKEGFQTGREAGYAEGERQGYEAGRTAAQSLEREAAARREEAEALHRQAVAEKEAALAEAREAVVVLAVEMARRILRREAAVHPEGIESLIAELLERGRDQERFTLRVHPDDAVRLSERRADLLADLRGDRQGIIPDPAIEPGGAVLETPGGVWDARVESQLAALEGRLREAIRDDY